MKQLKTRSYLLMATALLIFLCGNSYAQKFKNYSEMPALVQQEKKKGNNKIADSLAQVYIKDYLLKLDENELFTERNLTFINEHLKDVDGAAFKLFISETNRVNSILGADKAQYSLRSAISNAYFKNPSAISNSEWDALEAKLANKFGPIGLEEFYGKRMLQAYEQKDWPAYGKYYKLYFEKALKRPQFNINAVSWPLFENVNDPNILEFACDIVMKYAIEQWYQVDFAAWDTYANLLYKIGKRDAAIHWEQKAVRASNNENVFVETLEKMRKNIPTWNTTSN
ncbi:hypothetical protein HQN86_24980 [Pedobacter panaciterrae]|uniref:hypothetical protein n=1 Tax=Pedobacter panaciterrae TaxID=363849 RepID=UPI00155DC142|nr:hypothetical protein [Pedobacter panaciterrae]NQX56896.1 hypothetical protein [Pedobacter panaciterrae]